MTIKELKAAIFYLEDDMEVYLSSDEEGNYIKSVYSAQNENVYDNNLTGDIDVINIHDLDDYGTEFVKDGLVLWP